MSNREVVIVAAGRTAIGNFGGSLSTLSADKLGSTVIQGLLNQLNLPANKIDEVIFGQVLNAGHGQNPVRIAAINAGLPHSTPAMGISKVCGSGLKAIHLAAQSILLGDANIVIAGGQESMSQAAHILPNSRIGNKMGDWKLLDSMITDGLTDAFAGYHMGITAENVATKYNISREMQDEFAAHSQMKAEKAQMSGRFNNEIIPVSIPQRKGDPLVFSQDEFPKHGTTSATLSKLRPAFDKNGSVTAGNASGINDGAAALMIMDYETAKKLDMKPLAKIKAYANAGVDPAYMGTGPIPATQRCLTKAGWNVDELDLIEANEAFAAQAIAVNQGMEWNTDKVNVNGGAIALGHPIGASGCRIVVTLVHEMLRREANKGLATLCIGGGMGVSLAVERFY